MRVWKLEACHDDERIACRWGYTLAATATEALEMAKASSGLPYNWIHEKHPDMMWPGRPGEVIDWN